MERVYVVGSCPNWYCNVLGLLRCVMKTYTNKEIADALTYIMKESEPFGLQQEVLTDFVKFLLDGDDINKAANEALYEWDI